MAEAGVLERGDALLERLAGRVRGARVVVALVDADRLLGVRRGLVDRDGDRAGLGVGVLSRVDGACLEVHRGDRSRALCRRATTPRAVPALR